MIVSERTRGGHDAIVVGAGPNGLAAAIVLAEAGHSVQLIEAANTIGGGCRTAELTLPGYLHDPCSAIHPLAVSSPFFRALPLAESGLQWIHPPLLLAHPFDDGTAAVLARSVDQTADSLGPDASAYRKLFDPLVHDFGLLADQLLGPLRIPHHPIAMARFGWPAVRSLHGLTKSRFEGTSAPALLAGMAGHSMIPLTKPGTAAFGLVLALFGHSVGWPIARGGSQQIVNVLADHLRTLGGEIQTDQRVNSIDQFADQQAILFDVTPRQLNRIAGDQLPDHYRRQLTRYRYGAGVFKIDWALNGPVPWTAPECHDAGTLHLGGTYAEIAAAEDEVAHGKHPDKPFVIAAQPSVFDDTRAPAGKHTLWAYCHVPHGSTVEMTARIEDQIERFAPGFRDLVLARTTSGPTVLEQHNANYIGGDINGGVQDLRQLYTRPTPNFIDPYATPNRRIYLCSSSTPPGGGVHGMSGYHAAKSALRRAWD